MIDLEEAIDSLIGKPEYEPSGDMTRCNIFVRDLVRKILGEGYSGLDGQVRDQVAELRSSARWIELGENLDDSILCECLAVSYRVASLGPDIVVVAWQDPRPSSTNTGDIAVVSGFPPMEDSSIWNMQVPYIAHAGKNPKGAIRELMSNGFQANIRNQLSFFRYPRIWPW